MVYKLTEADLQFFLPNPNVITMDQVLPLMSFVLPNASPDEAPGSLYEKPDEKFVLYLDERENDKFLYIGGCLVKQSDSPGLIEPFQAFKQQFRPEITPTDWYLKGSGEWLVKGQKYVETKNEALTKWILWAKFLKQIRVPYYFHSVIVDKRKFQYKESGKKKRNIEIYRESYLALYKTLELQRYSVISIVTDNIEGAQYKGYLEASALSDSVLERNVIEERPVSKNDFSSEYSCWLQFVDMQIYASSRFVCPSGHNVLMNFEQYAYKLGSNDWHEPKTYEDYLELKLMEASYFILKDIFHHLRFRMKKNILTFKNDGPVSSMVLITDKEYFNFASDVDAAIFEFCNRNSKKAKITFSIDQY